MPIIRLTKNERKVLLLAAESNNVLSIVANMSSAVINLKIGSKRFSPEFLRALEGLCRKKCSYKENHIIFTNSFSLKYHLSPIGIQKAKLIKAYKKRK